jgi:hypothetical protein
MRGMRVSLRGAERSPSGALPWTISSKACRWRRAGHSIAPDIVLQHDACRRGSMCTTPARRRGRRCTQAGGDGACMPTAARRCG